MPQTGTHIIIAEEVGKKLKLPALQKHENALRLGGVGPDLALFLFDPVGSWEPFNTITDTLSDIRKIADLTDEIKTKVAGPRQDLEDWLTGGLSTRVRSLASTSYAALQSAFSMTLAPTSTVLVGNPFFGLDVPGIPNTQTVAVAASPIANLFRGFGHPYTSDPPFKPLFNAPMPPPNDYSEWWWVDLLHYRRTGRFARALQNLATEPVLEAYATGYMTHVGGDVCGHPYVNAVVGGPFRNHVIRHMTIEKVIDTWVWREFRQEDIVTASLHDKLNVDSDIEKIAETIRKAMLQVYHDDGTPLRPTHFPGSVPQVRDIISAYRRLLLFMELSTGTALDPPVPPASSPAAFFAEIQDSLAGTASSIGESFSSDNEWWEWLLSPFLAAHYALLLLFKLATLPSGVVARLVANHPKWYIYMLERQLYELVQNTRWTLALSGWGTPSSADLERPFAQLCTRLPPRKSYPLEQPDHSSAGFWLADPLELGARVEQPFGETESCPYRPGARPDVFINGPSYDIDMDRLLKQFVEPQENGEISPARTLQLEIETLRGGAGERAQFGNAVDFSIRLIKDEFPAGSFDLDADPGYGFLGWEGPPPVYSREF